MKGKMLHIMPECYVDTNLVEYLLGAAVNHQHSCTKVVGNMKSYFKNSFAIGVIDKDKVQMGYLSECGLLAQHGHLFLYRHLEKHHYIIAVSPAIDSFILDCAKDMGVDVTNYGLPPILKDFTKETKQVTSNKDPRFKALFDALKEHPEIQALKQSLMYLNERCYQVDKVELTEAFNA